MWWSLIGPSIVQSTPCVTYTLATSTLYVATSLIHTTTSITTCSLPSCHIDLAMPHDFPMCHVNLAMPRQFLMSHVNPTMPRHFLMCHMSLRCCLISCLPCVYFWVCHIDPHNATSLLVVPHVTMWHCHISFLQCHMAFLNVSMWQRCRLFHVSCKLQNTKTLAYKVIFCSFKLCWKMFFELFAMDPFLLVFETFDFGG